MAIKGKGKTKPKQPARAPKRAPVPVPKPFAQRTWVRVMASFIAGVFLVSMCWWVWEGLDKNRNQKAATAKLSQQQQAVLAWRATLEPTISSVGKVQGSVPPQVASTLQPAIDAIAKGTDPGVKATDLTTLEGQLNDAAKKLEKFNLTDAIANHEFDSTQIEVITSAHNELAAGLRSLAVAAGLTALAVEHPDQADALTAEASQAAATGRSLIELGWTKYSNVSSDAGVPLPVQQGLPGASGS
jgi:hypothetical protein